MTPPRISIIRLASKDNEQKKKRQCKRRTENENALPIHHFLHSNHFTIKTHASSIPIINNPPAIKSSI